MAGFFDDLENTTSPVGNSFFDGLEEVQKPTDPNSSDFTQGLQRGLQNLQATTYGAGALVGTGLKKLGAESVGQSLQDLGMEGYKRNIEEAKQYPAKHSFKDVYTGEAGIGGTVDWAQGTLGELVPSMVEAGVGAAIGSAVAPGPGTALGGLAARTVVKKGIEKGIEQALKRGVGELTEDQVKKQIAGQALKKLGGKVGIAGAVMPIESGGMYASLLQENGIDAPGTALLFGGLATALEFAGGNSKLVDTFVDALSKGATGTVKKTAKELLTNIPQEALQEGSQEAFSILNKVVNTDEKFLTANHVEQIIESMAAGAVGGSAGAAINAGFSSQAADPGPEKTPQEIDLEKRSGNILAQEKDQVAKSIQALTTNLQEGQALLADTTKLDQKARAENVDPIELAKKIFADNQDSKALLEKVSSGLKAKEELAKKEYEKLSPEDKAVVDIKNKLFAQREAEAQKINADLDTIDKRETIALDQYKNEQDPVKKKQIADRVFNLLKEKNTLLDRQKQVSTQQAFELGSYTTSKEPQKFYQDIFGNDYVDPTSSVNLTQSDKVGFEKDAQESAKVFQEDLSSKNISDYVKAQKLKQIMDKITKESDPVIRQKLYNQMFEQSGVKEAQDSAEVFANSDLSQFDQIVQAKDQARLNSALEKIMIEPDPQARQKLYEQMFMNPGVKDAAASAEIFAAQGEDVIANQRKQELQKIMSQITQESNPAIRQKLYNDMFLQPGVKDAQTSAQVFAAQTVEEQVDYIKNAKARARKQLTNSVFTNEQPNETVDNTVQPIELQEEADLNQAKLDQYAKDLKAAYVAGNLEIPQYMIAIDLLARKDIASIEQLLDALNGIKSYENDPLYARSSSFKAKGKADLERLIKMIGSQMYQGNLAEITIKEVVQNSFDAVKASLNAKEEKGITAGQIDIITDPGNRIIAIRDNGQGMSKQVLLDAFLTVAGTYKSGMATGDASGGFGMAKATFLYGNEWIELNTVKDGKRYKFKGTGSDIISKGVDITTEAANKNAHGTTIVIKVPEYVEVNGKQQYVWFPNDLNEISFFKQPLIHDSIEINLQQDYFSGEGISNISDPTNELWSKEKFSPIKVGKNFDLSTYDKPIKINFDWGHAKLYIGKERTENQYAAQHSILSAGVYQFKHPFEKIPYNVILNIFPSVPADSPSYPFNVRREGWKDNIEADVKSLSAYVKNIALGLEAQSTVEQFKNIQSLPRVNINDIGTNNVDLTEFFNPPKKTDSSKKPVSIIKPSEVTVKDGQVTGKSEDGKKVVFVDTNKKDSDDKKASSSFKADKEAPKAKDFLLDTGIDDNRPIFHNNTTADYFTLAKENGYSAETFFAEFGSLMLKVKDIFIDKKIYGYKSLADKDQSFFFGTSIDKGYHGVNLVVPFKSILVNPLAIKEKTLPGITHGLYDTFIHEFAHIPQRNHEQGFSEEVAMLKTKLGADGTDLELRVAIGRLIKKHKNLIELLRNEYEKSTTKNVAKPLNDTEKSDAVASRRFTNESNGGIESGNAEWFRSLETGEQSRKDSRVSTSNQTAGRNVTLEDIKRAFPGQEVSQSPDGTISVRFKNGQGLTINSIQDAGQGFIKYAIETGQMSKTGKILGITIGNEILLDENFADNRTLWHENKHVLDNLGLIRAEDDSALNREFNKLRKDNKLEFALSTHEDAKQRMVENRANMFAQIMVNRAAYRNTTFGKVIQRVMDFFQQMFSFGKQTVSGLAREVESGKIYERQVNGQVVQTTVPQFEDTAKQWYSALEKAVSNFQQKQATPDQWKGMIKNFPGIKQDELDWVGVNDWLDKQEGKVTQASLLKFIQENNVQLEEVIKGWTVDKEQRLTDLDNKLRETGNLSVDEQDEYNSLINEESFSRTLGTDTKYSNYKLPGGKNYQELLLTLPNKQTTLEQDAQEMFGKSFMDLSSVEIRSLQDNNNLKSKGYQSTHWEEPNILAHIRFNERTDADGNKVLFLEEIQSDWHQEGKKKGYQGDGPTQQSEMDRIELKYPNVDFESFLMGYPDAKSLFDQGVSGEDEQLYLNIADDSSKLPDVFSSIPNAPFKNSTQWSLLAMKRMVRYAAENGFDKIAWPSTPEQIAQIEGWGPIREERTDQGTSYFVGEKNVSSIVHRYITDLPRILNNEFNKNKWGFAKTNKINIPQGELNPLTNKYYQDGFEATTMQSFSMPITERMKSKALREGMPMFEVRDGQQETSLGNILNQVKEAPGLTGQLGKFISSFIPESKLDIKVIIDPTALSASYVGGKVNTITLRDASQLSTSLHEITHAVTVREMLANQAVRDQVIALMNRVKAKAIKEAIITPQQMALLESESTSLGYSENLRDKLKYENVAYGLLNEKEFLAQAMGNSQFQELLKATTIADKGALRNGWDAFVELIMKALGINVASKNAFSESLRLIAQLASQEKVNQTDESVNQSITVEQRLPDSEYDKVYNQKNNLLEEFAQQARLKYHEIKLLADKSFGSISTRLRNVDAELPEHLRWLDHRTSQKIIEVLKIAKPILDITNGKKNALGIRSGGMEAKDKVIWNWARLNADGGMVARLAEKYGFTDQLTKLREALDQIRQDAIAVGYDVGFIDEYWPRVIKDQEGFLQETQGISQRAEFTEAFRAEAKKLGITQEAFERDFPEVKADIISNLILKSSSGLGGPGNIQARVFETIDPKYAKYYMDADAALMQYVYSMTKKTEARRFFGKVPERITGLKALLKRKKADLIKYTQLADMARAENPEALADYEDRIEKLKEDIKMIEKPLNRYKKQNDYTENIGTYINDLMTEGRLTKKDEKVVSDILHARFNEHGTHGIVNALKNASYIDVMGSPLSAITQIGDLAWAMYVGRVWTPRGFASTVTNLSKAIAGKSNVTKEDLGFERIAQEFADGTTLSRAVSRVFKMVGLEKIDSIGKEVLINNALDYYKTQAKNPEALAKLIRPIFGNKSRDVVQEILATVPSDNVKMLLYSKVLDFQPMALSEMPEFYLKGGNWRVLYMLKTYTIKQFDVFRREVFQNIQSKDNQKRIQGITNMVQLMALLTLANAGADEIKDFMLGKESRFSDNLIENLWTLAGASRYVKMEVSKEGFGSAIGQQVLPPMKFINSASKDLAEGYDNYVSGDVTSFDHARIIDSIPVIGKLYYWHAGRGLENKKSLAEKDFSEAGKDASLFKKQLENSQDKRLFIQSNLDRFKQMKVHENFQAALNRNKAVINKLEKIPSTENVQTRLGQLKIQREQILKKYIEVRETL